MAAIGHVLLYLKHLGNRMLPTRMQLQPTQQQSHPRASVLLAAPNPNSLYSYFLISPLNSEAVYHAYFTDHHCTKNVPDATTSYNLTINSVSRADAQIATLPGRKIFYLIDVHIVFHSDCPAPLTAQTSSNTSSTHALGVANTSSGPHHPSTSTQVTLPK